MVRGLFDLSRVILVLFAGFVFSWSHLVSFDNCPQLCLQLNNLESSLQFCFNFPLFVVLSRPGFKFGSYTTSFWQNDLLNLDPTGDSLHVKSEEIFRQSSLSLILSNYAPAYLFPLCFPLRAPVPCFLSLGRIVRTAPSLQPVLFMRGVWNATSYPYFLARSWTIFLLCPCSGPARDPLLSNSSYKFRHLELSLLSKGCYEDYSLLFV